MPKVLSDIVSGADRNINKTSNLFFPNVELKTAQLRATAGCSGDTNGRTINRIRNISKKESSLPLIQI